MSQPSSMTVPSELPPHLYDTLPDDLLREILRLPSETQRLFAEDYDLRSKSVLVGYGLLMVGLHYAYLGDWFLLAAFWTACFFGIPGLLWFAVDLFRTQGLVRKHNARLARDILANIDRVRTSLE